LGYKGFGGLGADGRIIALAESVDRVKDGTAWMELNKLKTMEVEEYVGTKRGDIRELIEEFWGEMNQEADWPEQCPEGAEVIGWRTWINKAGRWGEEVVFAAGMMSRAVWPHLRGSERNSIYPDIPFYVVRGELRDTLDILRRKDWNERRLALVVLGRIWEPQTNITNKVMKEWEEYTPEQQAGSPGGMERWEVYRVLGQLPLAVWQSRLIGELERRSGDSGERVDPRVYGDEGIPGTLHIPTPDDMLVTPVVGVMRTWNEADVDADVQQRAFDRHLEEQRRMDMMGREAAQIQQTERIRGADVLREWTMRTTDTGTTR
jgi:hypothetical protein